MTKVIRCNCENEYQDKKYGTGKRVANKTVKEKPNYYRCTVCTKEHIF